jgi:hypothetical protein
MKLLSALLTLIIVLGVAPAQQESIPAELAYYDAQINVLTPRLIVFQDQYHSLTGGYFQALESNSTAPAVPVVPDGLSGSPTDQTEDLAYFWTNGAELPEVLAWSFSITTYAGPDGAGYVLTVSTSIEDVTWRKAINFGPEDWRGSSWHPVIASDY